MSIMQHKFTIDEIQSGLVAGNFSSEEITESYLAEIKKDKTNAFISINDQAIEQARQADQILAGKKSSSPLCGVPIAIKDIILVKGLKATAGSKILQNYIASYTATAAQRLIDEGMVVLGKTNCDEFAMGSSNENSAYGPVLNPVDISHVPGGSSGGSAAAVAGDLAPVALGTDTGGSIRQPAAFCGIVGLKPSYGRVSRFGSIALASSLDQIGPMTNSVKDAAYLMQYMAGYDKNDATSSKKRLGDYFTPAEKPMRIGVPKEYFSGKLDKQIDKAVRSQIDFLASQGHQIVELSLPNTDYALAAYYLLMPAEASSNLARYDGILYGMCADKRLTLAEWYKQVRSHGFGDESRRRIILGTYILSSGYNDAYYKQAQKVRTLIKADFAAAFQKADVLLTPATPTTAFKLGEKSKDPLEMYLSDIFTVGANIAGLCGLVLPAGQDDHGLPIGMQLLADNFMEENLFKLGYILEKNQSK